MRLVIIESPYKRCSRCATNRPPGEFCNDKSRSDGKHPWCKSCVSVSARNRRKKATVEAQDRQREYQRLWARKPENRQKILAYQRTEDGKASKRRAKRKLKYGITEKEYTEILASQEGLCAVCKEKPRSTRHTHTDHCHKTGRVRSVLCHNCNRALGAVKNDPKILRALISYLNRGNQCV